MDQHGVDYESVDVIADEAAYDEMIQLSGQELAPVIEFAPDTESDLEGGIGLRFYFR